MARRQQILFYAEEAQHAQLRLLTAVTGRSASSILRDILADLLEQHAARIERAQAAQRAGQPIEYCPMVTEHLLFPAIYEDELGNVIPSVSTLAAEPSPIPETAP